jgi:glucosylceramidase
MKKRKKNIYKYLLLIMLFTSFVMVEVYAQDTVSWQCTTNSNPWVDKGTLTTAAWDNDISSSYVSVNSSIQYQEIEGWGGAFNERGWDALLALSQTKRAEVIKAIFGDSGLKLNICRTPIGASDYAMDHYSYDETDSDYAMNNFSIERDKQMLIPYIKTAIAINPDIKIWGSPWSPPSWMKDNNKLEGGNILTDSKTMGALALYFQKYVEAYQAEGINLYMIMPQNEPGASTNYPSCRWNGNQLANFIKSYLGPRFVNNNVNCEIYLGTINKADYSYVSPTVDDESVKQYITGVGYQWGGSDIISKTYDEHPELKLMQTETKCGNHENDWTYAESQFGWLKHYLSNGANAYMLWNIVLDETGESTVGWAQCSPIVVNKSTKVVTYNPQYYLFKHFSYYIKPGAKRIRSEGSWPDRIAFINPAGEIVLILQNSSTSDSTVAINIDGKKVKVVLPAKSWNTFRSSACSNPEPVSGITVSPTTASIEPGANKQLTAIVESACADNKNVSWNSSDTSVATVNSSGIVSGVAEGSAVITATTDEGGFTGQCTVTVVFVPFSVNAGGPATGIFSADWSYTGGSTYSNSAAIDMSQITGNPPPAEIFNTERYGAFTYTVPNLIPGSGQVIMLYFAENYFSAAGKRVFNVSINGTTVLNNFDIYETSGGANKAIAESFNTHANSSGQVVIQFISVIENPKVSGIFVSSNLTSIKKISSNLPAKFELQNYPNPFNPTTIIRYDIPKEGYYTLKIYDSLGQEVTTLLQGNRSAGTYSVKFDASKLASGVYICQLSGNNVNIKRKILLMK